MKVVISDEGQVFDGYYADSESLDDLKRFMQKHYGCKFEVADVDESILEKIKQYRKH